MGQSKLVSMIEVVVNILVGYWLAVIAQAIVFPFFKLKVGFTDSLFIAGLFTGISLVRSYVLRRLFNRITWRGFV